jgi:catechol 2,3-dioxygenase-like lactoylglutathione lyase family enzyme
MHRNASRIIFLLAFTASALAEDLPAAHFHHLHLNATDPAAAIAFYTRTFDCEKARFAGAEDAVWAQRSWLLFTKVGAAPPWEPVSPVWHFGWGGEEMKATYQKQLDLGTKFFTPLTDITKMVGIPFFYAYVDGPDHALIELNTTSHHHFGHLHLFSEDPVAAGEWYMKHLGAKARSNRPPSREPRFYNSVQIGPSASLMVDNVNVIIYPVQYSREAYKQYWKDASQPLATTRGRVVDHAAFSFDDLAQALQTLRAAGVKVTDEVRPMAGKVKSAFVEGPDGIRIELVEGEASTQR